MDPLMPVGPEVGGPHAATRVLVSRRGACRTLVILVGLVACGGGKKNPTGSSAGDTNTLLLRHNARFNDGRTIRWATLPIPVFTNGIAREDEVTEWTRATGGRVTFAFVGSQPAAGIAFRFGGSGAGDICGVATVEYFTDGRIASVDVQVVGDIFRGPTCVRTVVHEVGHAIGFLDHTANGGLMDPDGGDGRFTEEVTGTIQALYALAPGTLIGVPPQPSTAERRAGGRSVITIVDPARS
jgi:hypothetical protein